MKTSERGIDMIVSFEGIELEAYKCPAGVWTIGVGHTGYVDGKRIAEGLKITRDKAYDLLRGDTKKVEDYLAKQPFAQRLKQRQLDALVSFIFNVGISAFETSTMRRKLCTGADDASVAEEFGRWVYGTVDGKKVILKGLVYRREKEAEKFLGV